MRFSSDPVPWLISLFSRCVLSQAKIHVGPVLIGIRLGPIRNVPWLYDAYGGTPLSRDGPHLTKRSTSHFL